MNADNVNTDEDDNDVSTSVVAVSNSPYEKEVLLQACSWSICNSNRPLSVLPESCLMYHACHMLVKADDYRHVNACHRLSCKSQCC